MKFESVGSGQIIPFHLGIEQWRLLLLLLLAVVDGLTDGAGTTE
jgi:hypothetical protein